jgi:hypothetical protein
MELAMFEAKARAGRVGHAIGQQAAEIHEVHLQDGAREYADEHERDYGDARAGEQPLQAGG